MATESPLLMHTQCTASVDMSPTGALAGLNASGQYLFVKLSGSRTVAPSSANTSVTIGVLQNDPKLGEAANVGFMGVTKLMSHAAITAGDSLMSFTDGTAMTATTPGTNTVCGIALETVGAAATLFTAQIWPHGID